MLSSVLSHGGARALMLVRNDLREAYAQVERKGTRFETALINAKQEAEVALSQIIGYDPDDSTLLEIGRDLRDTSDQLYTSMESISKKATALRRKKKK
jgi:hypothetical protein